MDGLGAGRRILILAPHPDDEIVACGMTALRARNAGAELAVLYLTTGIPGHDLLWRWQRSGYEARVIKRREEAIEAASLCGVTPGGFLEIPSRQLITLLDAAAEAVDRAIAEASADALWVTAFEGAHQDHDAANALAARYRDRLPVWEFSAYNYSSGRVHSNRFLDKHEGTVELRLNGEERALKRTALSLYASERRNLAHIHIATEAHRPLPRHNYAVRPYAGKLFRERHQWVPFRHPRIDFTPSAEIYAALGRWSASQKVDIAPAANG